MPLHSIDDAALRRWSRDRSLSPAARAAAALLHSAGLDAGDLLDLEEAVAYAGGAAALGELIAARVLMPVPTRTESLSVDPFSYCIAPHVTGEPS